MQNDVERRKVRAQFLNGLAVALISSGFLTPLATGSLKLTNAVLAVLIAAALHAMALMLTSRHDR